MRARLATSLTIALFCGCGGSSGSSSKPTSITVSPSGTVQVTGSTLFTATVVNTGAPVTWALAGPGSLSGTTGPEVVYRPPPQVGTATASVLTATAADASVTVNLTLGTAPMPPVKIAGLSAPVQVQYDAQDIPHISCAATRDCLAVQGYLHAHDRLFQIDFLRRVGRGRLATLVGPLGIKQDVQLRTLFTTRDGKRLEDTLTAALDSDTALKAAAYVSGINARLAELRADPTIALPGEYAQLPFTITAADIPDWTVQDTFALARLQQFQLSESLGEEQDFGRFAAVYGPGGPLEDPGKLNTYIRAAPPPTAKSYTLPVRGGTTGPSGNAQVTPADAQNTARLMAWRDALDRATRDFAELRAALRSTLGDNPGSNNWVIDAAHSANGHAMVANDPHLSLQYPPNFHLATMTSSNAADMLDVAGGAFPGVPGALVGRGAHVGWGVTVVGYDVTDLYVEQFLDHAHGCPAPDPVPCVLFNKAPVVVGLYPQQYLVRVGPGSSGLVDAVAANLLTQTQAFVAVVPHHGPVVAAPNASGVGVSFRWTGHESSTQDLKGFLGLITAPNVDGAILALKNYATGAQNFVLADDAGHIAYDPHALVPLRRFADTRINGANVLPPWFPLPGDGTAEWGTGVAGDNCAGVGAQQPSAACWIADSLLPQGKDPAKGFFVTANADPLGVSDGNNPLDPLKQPYLSYDWDDSTGFRHARITKRITDALAAGGGKVSLADMESIQTDHVSNLGGAFQPFIAAVPSGTKGAHFDLAATMIKNWSLDCPTGILGIDPVNSPNDPDPAHTADSAGCMLFHTFLRTLINNVFADDLKVAGLGVGPVQAIKGMIYLLQTDTPPSDQKFCNDVDANGQVVTKRTCQDQLVIALVTAYDTLLAVKGPPTSATGGWRWGRVHTMQPVSQFPLVTTGYQPGPFARPGGAFTVDVGSPSLSQAGLSFGFGSSGNVRHISVMDPASPIVKMQLPGPERDVVYNTFSSTPNLLLDWVQNKYFDFQFSSQINGNAVSAQTFNP